TGLNGASINLRSKNISRNSISGNNGIFNFTDMPDGTYKLLVSFVGYDRYEKQVTLSGKPVDLGSIALSKASGNLAEVVVKATTPPAQLKGDTVQYNASQFKVNPDANVEDLVKKMPGIQVENGQVKAHGENVRKVTIDGREFFGDDATAALRNLPAEIVEK